jgi:hypothetical protein
MNWTWQPARGTDVDDLVGLTQAQFEREADEIFQTDPIVYAHNITRSVVDQFYNPGTAFLWVARDPVNRVLGYVWCERGQRAVWSADEMVAVKIVHVDLTLPARTRLRLCAEMITLWERWARSIGVPIVCSTTMRSDQEGFLRLHERQGYERRGSICYKRLGPKPGGHGTDHGHEHSDGADLG